MAKRTSSKQHKCPHCGTTGELMISDWVFDFTTGMDYSNGYVCGKCIGKVEAIRKGNNIVPKV